jgi:hypothetical protein
MRIRALLVAGTLAVCGVLAMTGATASAAPTTAAEGVTPLAASEYYVTVRTGNLSDAGTDANIYVALFGSVTYSQEVQLDDSRDNFERNRTERFGPFFFTETGQVNSIQLRKDGSGSAWYPEYVRIENATTGAVRVCPVYSWYGGGASSRSWHCS